MDARLVALKAMYDKIYPKTSNPRHLGQEVRHDLYSGEDRYFRDNPETSGMAAEDGKIILNPYTEGHYKSRGVDFNQDAVIENEALRLYMRKNKIEPDFEVTPEQKQYYEKTPYKDDPTSMRQTILSRIYTGDPTAQATKAQEEYLKHMLSNRPQGG
jgi:hypothetical protein